MTNEILKNGLLLLAGCAVFILIWWNYFSTPTLTGISAENVETLNNTYSADWFQSKTKFNSLYSINANRNLSKIYSINVNRNLSKILDFNVTEFLSTNLVQHPKQANKLSSQLTTRLEIIIEAQRIHMNIFKNLGQYKYAMLFDYISSENKGDSAIGVGEVILLRRLNITVVFHCAIFTCNGKKLQTAKRISKKYSNKELVILFHGGGNVIGWPRGDERRSIEIEAFQNFHIVVLPQSILYIGPQSHIDFCKKIYASHKNLTFLWRDKKSYKLGRSLFPKVHSLLSPDIAYQIGQVPRFMQPTHDILWLRRTDKEAPSYTIPPLPDNLRVTVSDWLNWKTQIHNSEMENMHLKAVNGMVFLQRGRVVILDRLHGHILCTLLGIPHVYIDNQQKKISNYHNTWTANVENIVLANSSTDAIVQAEKLLKKMDTKISPVIRNFNLD